MELQREEWKEKTLKSKQKALEVRFVDLSGCLRCSKSNELQGLTLTGGRKQEEERVERERT